RGLHGFPVPKRLAEPLVEARQQLPQRAASRTRRLRGESAEQLEHKPPLLEADFRRLDAEACVPAQRDAGEPVRLAIADKQAERQRVREGQRLEISSGGPSSG